MPDLPTLNHTTANVIPAQAGILVDLTNNLFFQKFPSIKQDSRLRGNDDGGGMVQSW